MRFRNQLTEMNEEDFKTRSEIVTTGLPVFFTVDRYHGIIQVWPLPEEDTEFLIYVQKREE